MSLAIKGRIKAILKVESGTSKVGKEWKKQSFVVDTGEQYNPDVCFNLFGEDKINMLSNFNEGQEVVVAFNVSSREFNGKYYHNIDAWKIHGEDVKTPNTPHMPDLTDGGNSVGDIDDLPF